MDTLVLARADMGVSLAFHIVFAAMGVALPLLALVAEVKARRGDADSLELAKRLGKGTAILFAVGAVSGTVLSFELGLLWPRFMRTFGEVIGLPFALEGFAFFTEAIFLGIYLYGRGRVSPRLHLFSLVVVAVSGAASAFFVTLVNAWMNAPTGFRLEGLRVVDVDPIAAMFAAPWRHQVVHVLLSCYEATAFAMAAVHAWMLLRQGSSPLHRKALRIALTVGGVCALLQIASGDRSAKHVAAEQPLKFAAIEAHFRTARGPAMHLGGFPDEDAMRVRGSIEIPRMLGVLAAGDPDAVVRGLEEFPRKDWPPVAAAHWAFQVMVGGGSALAALTVTLGIWAFRARRRPEPERVPPRFLLMAIVAAGPVGFAALEAGWLTTELGRQPWIAHGVMRTHEAVTPFPHLGVPLVGFALIYAFLGLTTAYLLWRQIYLTAPGGGEQR